VRELVEALCSDRCAGREAGTPGGRLARELVITAFADAGYDTELQAIPAVGGANVLARLPGERDRWVIVAAHYDHVGRGGGGAVYRGADDNAAAVAILIEAARDLKRRAPRNRGVIFAAFDAEEPPNFVSSMMGSQYFVDHPILPLDTIDMMVCMDLVGHAVGSAAMPAEIRNTVFALGAERSAGTAAHVDAIARAVPGVIVRRVDAEAIPPLSDYYAFWQRSIPFLFLSNGRSRVYHTPEDTVEKLDFEKMRATAGWLARFVSETCERPEARIEWIPEARDDASTLRTLADVARLMEKSVPAAAGARAAAEALLGACGPDGRIARAKRAQLAELLEALEEGLA
jgi:Zn-dependent M28 family amino/carboxypeptidase